MDQCDVGRSGSVEERTADAEFAPHARKILLALYGSPERIALGWLGFGLLLVIGATAYAQIRLNAWNQPFYDALSHKDLPAFVSQLLVFGVIAGALLILNVAQNWLNPCLSGCYPHLLNVGCAHSPE